MTDQINTQAFASRVPYDQIVNIPQQVAVPPTAAPKNLLSPSLPNNPFHHNFNNFNNLKHTNPNSFDFLQDQFADFDLGCENDHTTTATTRFASTTPTSIPTSTPPAPNTANRLNNNYHSNNNLPSTTTITTTAIDGSTVPLLRSQVFPQSYQQQNYNYQQQQQNQHQQNQQQYSPHSSTGSNSNNNNSNNSGSKFPMLYLPQHISRSSSDQTPSSPLPLSHSNSSNSSNFGLNTNNSYTNTSSNNSNSFNYPNGLNVRGGSPTTGVFPTSSNNSNNKSAANTSASTGLWGTAPARYPTETRGSASFTSNNSYEKSIFSPPVADRYRSTQPQQHLQQQQQHQQQQQQQLNPPPTPQLHPRGSFDSPGIAQIVRFIADNQGSVRLDVLLSDSTVSPLLHHLSAQQKMNAVQFLRSQRDLYLVNNSTNPNSPLQPSQILVCVAPNSPSLSALLSNSPTLSTGHYSPTTSAANSRMLSERLSRLSPELVKLAIEDLKAQLALQNCLLSAVVTDFVPLIRECLHSSGLKLKEFLSMFPEFEMFCPTDGKVHTAIRMAGTNFMPQQPQGDQPQAHSPLFHPHHHHPLHASMQNNNSTLFSPSLRLSSSSNTTIGTPSPQPISRAFNLAPTASRVSTSSDTNDFCSNGVSRTGVSPSVATTLGNNSFSSPDFLSLGVFGGGDSTQTTPTAGMQASANANRSNTFTSFEVESPWEANSRAKEFAASRLRSEIDDEEDDGQLRTPFAQNPSPNMTNEGIFARRASKGSNTSSSNNTPEESNNHNNQSKNEDNHNAQAKKSEGYVGEFEALVGMIANGESRSVAAAIAEDPSLLYQKDKDGNTLLHHSVSDVKLLEWLLQSGANPNAQSLKLWTALHEAAKSAPNAVSILLQHSANPNAQDAEGMTPLHVAVENQWSAIPALLAAGANPQLQSSRGTALDMSARKIGVQELLMKAVRMQAQTNVFREPIPRSFPPQQLQQQTQQQLQSPFVQSSYEANPSISLGTTNPQTHNTWRSSAEEYMGSRMSFPNTNTSNSNANAAMQAQSLMFPQAHHHHHQHLHARTRSPRSVDVQDVRCGMYGEVTEAFPGFVIVNHDCFVSKRICESDWPLRRGDHVIFDAEPHHQGRNRWRAVWLVRARPGHMQVFKNVEGVVTREMMTFCIVNRDCFCSKASIGNAWPLRKGERVLVDVIHHCQGKNQWRAVRVQRLSPPLLQQHQQQHVAQHQQTMHVTQLSAGGLNANAQPFFSSQHALGAQPVQTSLPLSMASLGSNSGNSTTAHATHNLEAPLMPQLLGNWVWCSNVRQSGESAEDDDQDDLDFPPTNSIEDDPVFDNLVASPSLASYNYLYDRNANHLGVKSASSSPRRENSDGYLFPSFSEGRALRHSGGDFDFVPHHDMQPTCSQCLQLIPSARDALPCGHHICCPCLVEHIQRCDAEDPNEDSPCPVQGCCGKIPRAFFLGAFRRETCAV